ncbi:STM3941 family protein [Streptococcus hyovaginalis]|uniref:STM3941 family protein n=1 Tax=Streptococcus hyovaginalis TaxID=149015 RepID=UPI002A7CA390|nr:STM3941 family protein [Streptococcus hyovaginalis]MDY3024821.1 STM3941 family protein [Streptococcus hyovaginalis]MDY4510900.1 STM3941 family protein [Streptococcus hyovaginalis]MDY5973578.1 STM3941 family protein [Streptococcus hyovaginalis]
MIEPIIIPSRKLGNIIYALGSLIFVILGLILLLTADILPILVGLFSIAFFGWCFIIFVKRIFNNQPLLMVDQHGITDHSSALALGFVPWQDIENIQLRHMLNQTFISVSVKDQEVYLAKMSSLQRNASKTNLKMGYPLINISLNTTGKNPKKIYQDIEDRFGHFYGK